MVRQKLSPTEVSQELGIPRTTVYDIVKRGLLLARKISPRRIIVDREDLEKFLASTVITPRHPKGQVTP